MSEVLRKSARRGGGGSCGGRHRLEAAPFGVLDLGATDEEESALCAAEAREVGLRQVELAARRRASRLTVSSSPIQAR